MNHRRSLLFAAIAAVAARCVFPNTSEVQFAPPQINFVRSQTGQFIVHPWKAGNASAASNTITNRNFIRLQPTLLTVSCERIKQILYRELGTTAPWRGKIYLRLYPAEREQNITLTAQHFRDAWHYQLELPDQVDRERYVRAIVQ